MTSEGTWLWITRVLGVGIVVHETVLTQYDRVGLLTIALALLLGADVAERLLGRR